MAATSSTRQKHQWRPSRGGGQNRGVSDLAGNSSSDQKPSPAFTHRSINDSLTQRHSSSSSSLAAGAADTLSDKKSSFTSTCTYSSSSAPPPSSAALCIKKNSSFIPYLPQDDAVAAGLGADQGGIDAVETQQVADILNDEFCRLLKMQPFEFWKAVTTDNSIQVSLDSYLQFRRRWYDSQIDKPLAGVIVGDQELSRRVFMVLYRMSLSAECGSQPMLPEECRVGAYQKQYFDIPKLLDICAIYGHDNTNITRQLVNNAFAINEKLYDDLADIVPLISKTVLTLQQRCSSTLMMQLPTESSGMSVVSKIEKELLEVLDYLNDAVISLKAFVDAHPEGVVVLILVGNTSDSKDQLLFTLATVHDSLIPTLQRSFSQLQRSSTYNYLHTAAETRSTRLRLSLIELVWKLLCFSYLKESNKADSQNSLVNNLLKSYICNPRARGEGFIQTLSGMLEEPPKFFTEEVKNSGVLIRNIDRNHKLLERVNQLRNKGLISLDTVQYDYAEAIITHSNVAIPSSSPNYSVLLASNQGLSEDVLNESKISHIKDILPDLGSGFIAACLEAYDNDPEEVIQRILEGTLHPTLQTLDSTLEVKPASQNASAPVKDKGKGKVDEVKGKGKVYEVSLQKQGSSSNSTETQTRWQDDGNGLAQRRFSSMLASSSSINEDSKRHFPHSSDAKVTKDSMQGRYVRKDKVDENVESVLNERCPDDVLRTAAFAAQYEDEYDDSFDDLGAQIADGVEETEILADMSRSKASVGRERGFNQVNKISNGGGREGIRRGWSVNDGVPRNEVKGTSARENNNKIGDSQRKIQPKISRGRGKGRRDEPRGQFYLKDGVNYSYKVAGSIAVASAEEAEAVKKVERETIHGLGQGGNVPVTNEQATDVGRPHINSRFNHGSEPAGRGGGVQSCGRGYPRKDHNQHHRKDRAMQKHFAGLGNM